MVVEAGMRERLMIRTLRSRTVAAAAIGMLLTGARELSAQQLKVDVALAQPYLLAGEKQTTYVRVGLTGQRVNDSGRRAPVNVAIVLDKSGSMEGEKLRKVKEAALASIDRLGPNDIVSVIAYDQTVQVLAPASKVSDRVALRTAIERLTASGNTALFAGVSKGAAEVRKFADRQRVNRILLLSDGKANVGPSSPAELGDIGASLIKEGISVTTFGLGLDYNEDLMSQLARRSDGNHYFIEHTTDLARKFGYEFDDVLTVAAQQVTVQLTCGEGVRPVRVLGREADITGQSVTTYLNQVYGDQEKYVLLELEVPAGRAGTERPLVDVSVDYHDMAARNRARTTRRASARFTGAANLVSSNTNAVVMASAIEQIAVERNQAAVRLRDQGRIEDARRALLENATLLSENGRRYNSQTLLDYEEKNRQDAASLDPGVWEAQRKAILDEQNIRQSQGRILQDLKQDVK
jgi:Ca-activated chloride channel family protein